MGATVGTIKSGTSVVSVTGAKLGAGKNTGTRVAAATGSTTIGADSGALVVTLEGTSNGTVTGDAAAGLERSIGADRKGGSDNFATGCNIVDGAAAGTDIAGEGVGCGTTGVGDDSSVNVVEITLVTFPAVS